MKEIRLCYISRNYRGIESSGNKAKTDNEETLADLNAYNLGLPTTYYNSKILTFCLNLIGILRMVCTLRSGDMVVLQYPVKKYFAFICRFARLRGASTIALIHDLGSMRRKKITTRHEISRLMKADYVIASNEHMEQYLRENGYTHPLGALGLFDYRSLTTPQEQTSWTNCPRVVYAGALAENKNSFLRLMSQQVKSYQLDIYGNKNGLPGLTDSEHVKIGGFMPSDAFIEHVEGHFGLVWDGADLHTCSGSFGEYLRWNSPHKVSFYLRAGLPVIIWRQAALAKLVQEEGIGLCIDSLEELNDLLPTMTAERYEEMKKQVQRVSERLRTGRYFTEALQKAIGQLTK
uniref:Sugar transferase n=1 Tax=Prevotella sp. GTC17254 TaxID=3236794 RepID=A0AB33J1L7_9BACT